MAFAATGWRPEAAVQEFRALGDAGADRLRRSLLPLFSALACGTSNFTLLENLEVSATLRMGGSVGTRRSVEFAREPQGRVAVRSCGARVVDQPVSYSHHEVWRRLRKSLLPRRRNPSVSVLQLTISRNALRISDECTRGPRMTSKPLLDSASTLFLQILHFFEIPC